MSANPNPAYITDALWRLWDECAANIPGVRLGGIYANKSGYHNTVNANQANWSGEYSTRVSSDLTGPYDKARAIDLTMDDDQMMLRTSMLRDAANAQDGRLACIRSFIGTTDTWNVDCWIHDYETQTFRYDGGRDDSHLWHLHISIFTEYCAVWDGGLDGLLSALLGSGSYVPPAPLEPPTYAPFPYPAGHYLGQPDPDPCCHSGFYGGVDTDNVRLWQSQMRYRGWSIGTDGMYGEQSQSIAAQFQAEKGLAVDGLTGPSTWEASWTAPLT